MVRITVMLVFFILVFSCNATKNLTTIKVASKQVDCQGVVIQKCLLVKKENQSEWEYFYENIEGFAYEPGFEYTLKIREETVENLPADGSSIKYILVKELSKVKN